MTDIKREKTILSNNTTNYDVMYLDTKKAFLYLYNQVTFHVFVDHSGQCGFISSDNGHCCFHATQNTGFPLWQQKQGHSSTWQQAGLHFPGHYCLCLEEKAMGWNPVINRGSDPVIILLCTATLCCFLDPHFMSTLLSAKVNNLWICWYGELMLRYRIINRII